MEDWVPSALAELPIFPKATESLLLLHAMESKKTMQAELAEIRALLDQFDRGR